MQVKNPVDNMVFQSRQNGIVVVVVEVRPEDPDVVKAIVWVERNIILKRHEDKTQLLKNKLFQ
jgi:hypothetical protein